jgi:hypothetical protein
MTSARLFTSQHTPRPFLPLSTRERLGPSPISTLGPLLLNLLHRPSRPRDAPRLLSHTLLARVIPAKGLRGLWLCLAVPSLRESLLGLLKARHHFLDDMITHCVVEVEVAAHFGVRGPRSWRWVSGIKRFVIAFDVGRCPFALGQRFRA